MPLQDTIHRWTTGAPARLLNVFLVFLGMIGLAVWYNLAAFKNFASPEAFDAAQLARNVADGRGFTTDFVRPFSMYLLKRHRGDHDPQVRERHPDIANAPLYPLFLAGVLKAMPYPYPNVVGEKEPTTYSPELWIAFGNQLLFFVAVILLFRLGARLFDQRVGWMSAGLFAGTDLFWHFSVSGLPTMLAIVLVLALADLLSRIGPADPNVPATPSPGRWVGLSAAAGIVVGLAALTRYSFGWLIVPVVLYLATLPVERRAAMIVTSVAAFLLVFTPWIARNILMSGTPFGTAGYAIYEETRVFPGFELPRTVNANFSLVGTGELARKLLIGVRDIVENQLPRLGGNWISAFFLVGLLVPFRNPRLNRLRVFILLALGILIAVQAVGRTEISAESPVFNGENLLVVLAPLVFLFGVSLFYVMADQLVARDPGSRSATVTLLVLVSIIPLLFSLLRPVPSPLSQSYYDPRSIQDKAAQISEGDWMMTDIPWAVAWYGARQSVWLSLRYKESQTLERPNDFAAIDTAGGKPLRALYLSGRMSKSVDTWGLWSWIHRSKKEDWEKELHEWEAFLVAGAYAELQVPTGFRLKETPFGLWPELFLMDSERAGPNVIKGE